MCLASPAPFMVELPSYARLLEALSSEKIQKHRKKSREELEKSWKELEVALRKAKEESAAISYTYKLDVYDRQNKELEAQKLELLTRVEKLQEELVRHERIITDKTLSEKQMRKRLAVVSRGFSSRLGELSVQFEALEYRAQQLEREIALNNARDEIRGREIERLQEQIVSRHEVYVSPNVFWSNAPGLGRQLTLGFGLSGQYNFTDYGGLFAGVSLISVQEKRSGLDGSLIGWGELGFHIGGIFNFLPSSSPVSIQIGSGMSVGQARLRYLPPGVEPDDLDAERELISGINVGFLSRLEAGVTIPRALVEPYVTFEIAFPLRDWTHSDAQVQTSLGRMVWHVGTGLRFRTYLTGD